MLALFPICCLLAILALTACAVQPRHDDAELRFRVEPEPVARVSPLLFGQFLERASFGEPGPEAYADPETGELPADIVARLEAMRIPLIRFPGGTDIDFIDWRDMIDGVPGRTGGRPVTRRGENRIGNRFGYDEYFALRDRLGCQTIIVLNLFDALLRTKDLDRAVTDAVGLLAYCNAQPGAPLPAGMDDWPAVRAANGHPEPFRCEYVQIGNEWTFKRQDVVAATGIEDPAELARWYLTVLHRYLDVIRAVDPTVRILVDADVGKDLSRAVLGDARLRAETAGAAIHRYAPGNGKKLRRGGRDGAPVAPEELTAEDWWYACATMPAQVAADGSTLALDGEAWELARELGYPVICTEWNWNGWSLPAPEAVVRDWLPMAKACGTAGFLHGLMRQGDAVALATQSMLLGHRWDITALRADPEGRHPPYHLPQGLATTLYNLHHGDRLLEVVHEPLPRRPQPFIVGEWTKWPERMHDVATVDLVVSADEDQIYVHVIQRHATDALRLRIDLRPLGIDDVPVERHSIRARPYAERGPQDPAPCAMVSGSEAVSAGELLVELPPRSVHVLVVPLR